MTMIQNEELQITTIMACSLKRNDFSLDEFLIFIQAYFNVRC